MNDGSVIRLRKPPQHIQTGLRGWAELNNWRILVRLWGGVTFDLGRYTGVRMSIVAMRRLGVESIGLKWLLWL